MKAAMLVRTGSLEKVTGAGAGAAAGNHFLRRSQSSKMTARSSLNFGAKEIQIELKLLRRARSDTDLVNSVSSWRIEVLRSPPSTVKEEEEEASELGIGTFDLWRKAEVVAADDEEEFSGGGMGKGRKNDGGGGSGGGGDSGKIVRRYQEMLRADPGNPLLLRNYGQFLHEVEGNLKGAEECYGRAILASPRDGDVLSLYGKLVWEAHADGERAANYFERAVEASPDDCYVLGSYAKFLWDVEEDDEDEGNVAVPSSLVEAF